MIVVPRFKLFSLVALLCLLPYISACGQTELTPAEYVAQAQDYFDKDNYEAAAISLRNALQKDPQNLEARWLLARVAIELGDGAAAEKEIGRAIDLGLSIQAARPLQIQAIFLQGDYDRVIVETSTPTDGLPATDQATIFGLKGQAYLEQRNFSDAKQALDAALEIDPKSVTGLTGMGRFHALKEDYAEARRWTQLAIDADESAPEPWAQLGELEWAEGNVAAAEAAFGKAIELKRYPTIITAKRAFARIQLGNFAGAAEDIRSLKQAGITNHPYVNYVEGIGYFKQEEYQRAAEAFEAALRTSPSYLQAKLYLASTYLIQGKNEQAQALAEQVNLMLPNSPVAKNLLGTALARQSDFDAARKAFVASLQQSPDNPQTLSMLGTLALMDGNVAEGANYFLKVVELEPDSRLARHRLMTAQLLAGQALNNGATPDVAAGSYESEFLLALAAFQQKNFGNALERARTLHEKYPDKIDPLNLMAACHLTLADWPKAREVLGQALEIDPTDPTASKNLARIEMTDGNLDEAKELLQRLSAKQPDDREAVLLLVDIETRQGNEATATQLLEAALKRSPDDAALRAVLVKRNYFAGRFEDVLVSTQDLSDHQVKEQPSLLEYRGRVQSLIGDVPSAKRSFERWATVAPDSAQAHLLLADTLAKTGDLARAAKELKTATKLAPAYLPGRVATVRLLAQQGENKKARQVLAKIKEEFGEQAEVLGVEGELAMQDKEYAKAEALFAKALAQKPDTELVLLRAQALGLQKKPDEAVQVMQTWVDEHPEDVTVLLNLAGTYLGMDQPANARATYERVVKIVPRHVPALNNLAWLSRDTDLTQAIAYAERAYQLAPNDPQVLDTLGTLLGKSGEQTRRYELVREAATLAPNDAGIQLHLAEALVQQKKYPEAERLLNTLIGNPADPDIVAEAEQLLKSIPSRR